MMREPNPPLMISNVERSGALAAWKTLSRTYAADGITFNTVLPGRIGTERLRLIFGSDDVAAADIPAGRTGTVEEFAAVATFLCSAPASYVTGAALLVDRGLTRAT